MLFFSLGGTYDTLAFFHRVSTTSIASIIEDACLAIIEVLAPLYGQVSSLHNIVTKTNYFKKRKLFVHLVLSILIKLQ